MKKTAIIAAVRAVAATTAVVMTHIVAMNMTPTLNASGVKHAANESSSESSSSTSSSSDGDENESTNNNNSDEDGSESGLAHQQRLMPLYVEQMDPEIIFGLDDQEDEGEELGTEGRFLGFSQTAAAAELLEDIVDDDAFLLRPYTPTAVASRPPVRCTGLCGVCNADAAAEPMESCTALGMMSNHSRALSRIILLY